MRRPGTKYVGGTKNNAYTRLLAFEISIGNAFIIEFGAGGYFRFWQNEAPVLSGGVPYEVAHTYTLDDLASVRVVQNKTDMYFFHPNYAARKLSYVSATSWTFGVVQFKDGPYLAANNTSTTMQVDANSGSGINLTVSSVTGINGGAGFTSADIGRIVRYMTSSGSPLVTTGDWFVITSIVSTTHVVVTCLGKGNAVLINQPFSTWRLGIIKPNINGGNPSTGEIHESRLFFTGIQWEDPRRICASVSGDYENFEYDDSLNGNVGVITDASGFNFVTNSRKAQQNIWLESDEKSLICGTQGDEWTIRPSVLSEAMSPTNIDAKAVTAYGSNPTVVPVKIGKSILFVQRYAKKLREMGYYFDVGGYRSPERTKFAEHVAGPSGFSELAVQKEPHTIVWAIDNRGHLLGMTHDEEDGVISVGWHRHTLGANSTPAYIYSIAVIPSSDGTTDQVWMVVLRTVNGVTAPYIEVMQRFWSPFNDALSAAWYLDCAKQFTPGGTFTTITGLTHIENETVSVWGDGKYLGEFTVSNTGTITGLPYALTTAIVGWKYLSQAQMLRLDSGSADGTSIGKLRRTHQVGFMLKDCVDFSIGPDLNTLTPVNFRGGDDSADTTVEFSGIIVETIDMNSDRENQVAWAQSSPGPGTILAVMPRMDTEDAL